MNRIFFGIIFLTALFTSEVTYYWNLGIAIKKDKPGDKYLGGPFSIAKLESDAMSSMKIVNDKKKIS